MEVVAYPFFEVSIASNILRSTHLNDITCFYEVAVLLLVDIGCLGEQKYRQPVIRGKSDYGNSSILCMKD
jgi:hypothetical protein